MKNFLKVAILSSTILATSAFADTYTVKYGDTFLGIALRHGLTQTQLQNLNPSVDIERLKAGTKLEIGNAKPVNRIATATVQQPSKEITIQPQQRIVNENVAHGVTGSDLRQYQQPIQQVHYQPIVQQPINYYQPQVVPQYQPINYYQPQVQYQPIVHQPTGEIVIINGQTYLIQPVQPVQKIR